MAVPAGSSPLAVTTANGHDGCAPGHHERFYRDKTKRLLSVATVVSQYPRAPFECLVLGRVMSYKPETPFDSIESSHQYVTLLGETIEEVRRDIQIEIARAIEENADRRKEALQLVAYHLTKLSAHMMSSRRILNDLRSLRRLLLSERKPSS